MVKSGTKAASTIKAAKNTALSTCRALIRISRRRSVHPVPEVVMARPLVGSAPQARGELSQQALALRGR